MPSPIRQLLSQTSYNADGSTTVWNFSFSSGYLDKAHVKAFYLDAVRVRHDVTVTLGMFLGPYQLSIVPAVPNGCELTIYRDTPKDAPLVNFVDKAVFTEASLDILAQQAIFVAAEAVDNQATAIESAAYVSSVAEAAVAAQDAAAASAVTATWQAAQATIQASNADSARILAESAKASATASAASIVRDGAGGVAGLTGFKLNLRNIADTFTSFLSNTSAAVRNWAMPDKDGTVALTSDLVDYLPAISSAVGNLAASYSATDGATHIGFDRSAVASAIDTADWAIRTAGEGCNVLRYITPSLWAGVKAETNHTSLHLQLQSALDAERNLFFPEGWYEITSQLSLSNGHCLLGVSSSDGGARIRAIGCNAFNVTAKDTRIENIRVYQDAGAWAFTYDSPALETSSYNNINNNNYVSGGGAFKLSAFSRSVISNFNSSELAQGLWLPGGQCVNVAVSNSLFQGHNNPAVNASGEFAIKVDVGAGAREGFSFTAVKFISFYDGLINNALQYSTFTACIFDYINHQGYLHTGYNLDIKFIQCYFAQLGYVAFPVVNGFSSFIEFSSIPTEISLYNLFTDCTFICYSGTFGPQLLANVREKNMGITFTRCVDAMSQSAYSVALYLAKNCIIKDNLVFKAVVASGSYSATPDYSIDISNTVESLYKGSIREFSSRNELLTAPNSNAGTLTSKIMTVDATNPTKVFKVYVHQVSANYGAAKEYLVYMDYVLNASVTTGIVLLGTAPLDGGDLGRVSLALTAVTANTNKTMTFVWVENITPLISIERVL